MCLCLLLRFLSVFFVDVSLRSISFCVYIKPVCCGFRIPRRLSSVYSRRRICMAHADENDDLHRTSLNAEHVNVRFPFNYREPQIQTTCEVKLCTVKYSRSCMFVHRFHRPKVVSNVIVLAWNPSEPWSSIT